jgi:flagellar hook-basal body complex protein FliE
MPLPTSAAGAYAATQKLSSALTKPASAMPGLDGASRGTDFSALLEKAVGGVTESGRRAEAQVMSVANGKSDLVDVVTAVAESETALQTLVAVRDRVISAYEEIMRMQI